MKGMIPGLASRFLTAAMARNAWTFAGTGKFSVKHGNGATLTLRGCPICRGGQTVEPCCDYYAGTFERLYARLVHADARVAETACEAGGAEACVFSVRW